ncbi:hypothetical protein [Tanticharoenia sakaeratensis]|uniref:Porin n=1 Tax=Tanticharoenia sakaeratensis NBRC 103193 TaxID=1231623 RepID=A0A0D6MN51_9PROT|nr:hypothetical protein [Tanticharoenia sakaeratensis]GAN54820.1 hypothetical protein Tasa_031_038 [Tanticharoenia sakaeratensis NBRC 103193]GBQ21458.1 hypothetical protein AA103193_1735 [Tanticharoenia sakaeratensis NBRC 103193]
MTFKARSLTRGSTRLMATTALMSFAIGAGHARAASTDQMAVMEKQIRAMQAQLVQMHHEHDAEVRQARAVLAKQREDAETNPYAVRNGYTAQANGPSGMRGTHIAPFGPTAPLLPPSNAATPYAAITGTPHSATNLQAQYGPLHRGQLQIGGVRVTLGGFAEMAAMYRSRNDVSDISSNFGSIPYGNSPEYHMNEFHQSERQSRFSILAQGNITDNLRTEAYVETDFQGAGSSSNSRQSNSYVLRARLFYGQLIDQADDLQMLFGQNWSLITMFNHGMSARDEQIPLSIDAQYIPGFNWTRNSQLRIVKGFDDHKIHAAISIENPQGVVGAGSGGVYTPTGATAVTYQEAGVNVNNPDTNYTTDVAPDVVGKLAFDPGWGHYEMTGVLRFEHDRVSYLGSGDSHTTVAGGGGGGLILPLEKKHKINFQASGLVGTGIGRYGTSNIPDFTFDKQGHTKPLPAANVLVGLYGNVTPALQAYAYGGLEEVRSSESFNVGSKHYGYGNPLYNVSGCDIEGASSSLCQTSLHQVAQGTVGFWWNYLKGDYGTLRVGAQYSYTYVDSFSGVGGTPHTNDNMVFFSLRYMPFN